MTPSPLTFNPTDIVQFVDVAACGSNVVTCNMDQKSPLKIVLLIQPTDNPFVKQPVPSAGKFAFTRSRDRISSAPDWLRNPTNSL